MPKNYSKNRLHKYTEALPAQVQLVIQQIFDLVNRTDFTALGVIGFLILFGTILKSLSTIEEIFNKIWGIKVSRSPLNKAGNYLLILLLVPLLITASTTMIASVLSDYISPFLATVLGKFYILYEFAIAFSGILGVISAFTLMYFFLPNTRVKFSAAFIGDCLPVSSGMEFNRFISNCKLVLPPTTRSTVYLQLYLFFLFGYI